MEYAFVRSRRGWRQTTGPRNRGSRALLSQLLMMVSPTARSIVAIDDNGWEIRITTPCAACVARAKGASQ